MASGAWHGHCSPPTMVGPHRRRSVLAPIAAILVTTGCGATASVEAPPGDVDRPGKPSSPPPPPVVAPDDHGSVSTKYPAYPPNIAQIVKQPGRVLKNPVVVTVTFATDPNAEKLEAVGDQIGASDYWTTIVGEYGIGPVTSGPSNHVHLTTPITLPTPRAFRSRRARRTSTSRRSSPSTP